MTKDEKRALDKALAIQKNMIKIAENKSIDASKDYLAQFRAVYFILLKHGENSKEYQHANNLLKSKLQKYLMSLSEVYRCQHLDVKEFM